METETTIKNDGHRSRDIKGVVQSFGGSSIPKELLTPGPDINAAIGRTIFRDEEQKNAFIIYFSQLCMFFEPEDDEMIQYLYLLNMAPSVKGISREQSLEGHIGILRALVEYNAKNKDKDRKEERIQQQGQNSGKEEGRY